MFPTDVICETALMSKMLTTVITNVFNPFMFRLHMSFQYVLAFSLILTLITRKLDILML